MPSTTPPHQLRILYEKEYEKRAQECAFNGHGSDWQSAFALLKLPFTSTSYWCGMASSF